MGKGQRFFSGWGFEALGGYIKTSHGLPPVCFWRKRPGIIEVGGFGLVYIDNPKRKNLYPCICPMYNIYTPIPKSKESGGLVARSASDLGIGSLLRIEKSRIRSRLV